MILTGAMTALITPFKNGEIDKAKLRQLVDIQIENGIQAIVPCGTTGESATLTHEEHNTVIDITIRQAGGRVPVIAGTGSNSTRETIALSRHARDAGADACLLITPYYNKPTQDGLYAHFAETAEKVDIPIILYNVPGRTSVNLAPETVKRLSKHNNIIAIKEASGNLEQVSKIISNSNIIVLSGDDSLTLPILSLGGRGVISVASNIAPKDVSLMVSSFEKGDIAKARRLHYKLFPIFKGLFIETNPAPVKAAMAMMGIIDGELRLPLTRIRDENRERLKKILEEYGLIKETVK